MRLTSCLAIALVILSADHERYAYATHELLRLHDVMISVI